MIQTLLPENGYLPPDHQIQYFLADRAYDTNAIREALIARDIQAVIPPKKNRIDKTITYDAVLYKERNIIERNWLFLKHFRRIFTRYDKLDTNYAGFILLGYIVQRLRKI
jgi:transposase